MMTSTQWPEANGKNSSSKPFSLKDMRDLQKDRIAYDEFYRKVAYVPDDFPIYKVVEKNVKKWALCGTYSTDSIKEYGEGYVKSIMR